MSDISNAVTIVSIETTQAIQTFPPRVPLVAHKRTVVRLMARHNLGPNVVLLGARARMRVIKASGPPSAWFDPANGTSPPSANPGFSLTLKDAPDRSSTDDSFNFLVPAALCSGTVQWEFDLRVDAKAQPAGAASGQARVVQRSIPMRFEARNTPEIQYVRVDWAGQLPTDAQCIDALRRGCQLLPMSPPVIYAALGAIMIVHPGTANVVFSVLQRLIFFREAVDSSTVGLLKPPDDGIWCAIFDNPGHGIQGQATLGYGYLVAHADRFPIAHELGHCFNQKHLDAQCPLWGPAADAEDSSSFPDGGQITDIPFDVIDNEVAPLAAGGAYWDVMTYCQGTRWTSPERWRRIWNEIGPP